MHDVPDPTELRRQLEELHLEGRVLTSPERREAYAQDEAVAFAGFPPEAVVLASSVDDVVTVLRWAFERGVPVVPRGAGTGLSGGAAGVQGSVVLSLEAMREITILPDERIAEVEAGAINADVKRAAATFGLWYPPDPGSFEISTIGGNVATNAGGLCCLKYGVTSDYVLGMDVVLADGTIVTLGGRTIKDSAGLQLPKLFTGSEGVLGVITKVTLRLVPAPAPTSTLVAAFPTVAEAAGAVLEITRKSSPSVLELMDFTSINVVEDYLHMGLDRSAGALLLARSDSPHGGAQAEIELMERTCVEAGASEVYTTDDEDEGNALSAARRSVGIAMEALGPRMTEDVGVPVSSLQALVTGIEEIAAVHGVKVALVAHAGDGNTHPTIFFDPADPDSVTNAEIVYDKIMKLGISLGGTITGEHGIGKMKTSWLPDQLGASAMEVTRLIKAALDPTGILNPGAVLAERQPR